MVAVTEKQAIDRCRKEQIIIDSLMRMRDREVDEAVETFVRNNEEFLERGNADISHADALIKEIDEIYADYDKYKDKICYFKKQYDDLQTRRRKEMEAEIMECQKQFGDIFKW